jgi:hypothetical protein
MTPIYATSTYVQPSRESKVELFEREGRALTGSTGSFLSCFCLDGICFARSDALSLAVGLAASIGADMRPSITVS